MSYRVDIQVPWAHPVACSIHPSSVSGMTVCANADGSALCVQPDGSEGYVLPNGQRLPGVPAGDPNWDSPYTQGALSDGFLIYQSDTGAMDGVPRGYRIFP